MVEEVCKNIFRIGVALPGNPLKELNSYFIRGEGSDLLIDTGFRRDACRESLEAALAELGSDPARRDVLVTHLHSDHSGMADLFAGEERTIWMGETDLAYFRMIREGEINPKRDRRFLEEGFTREQLDEMYRTNPAMTESMKTVDPRFRPLRDGDGLKVGGYELETICVPGHTPGNCVFYLRNEQVMFTGDHILFTITPNITWWPGVEDTLGDYLENLQRVKGLPVQLSLPGHRETGDFATRIDELLAHHERRIAEALRVVGELPGAGAYAIAGRMKWKITARDWDSFPLVQKWFAVGECMSHLDYLLKRGKIRCEITDNMRKYYAN